LYNTLKSSIISRMKKKPSIKKAILKTLSNKGVTPIDSIQEDVSRAILGKFEPNNKAHYAISRSIKNLLGYGLVEAFNSDHKQYFRLTKEGKQKLNSINLENEYSLVSTVWDGYWRIILLDISEDRKNEREALRYLLKKAGFVCLKNSVWISMYPFEHLFTNIKKDLNLSTELIIIVTDKIDEETEKEFLRLCK
jgi:DNA-binding transcriptional regulator PaaX